MEEHRNFGVILERDADGVPTKGHRGPKLLGEEEMHPRPEVVMGEIDMAPTILPPPKF